mgnify:CR=1 FL=1
MAEMRFELYGTDSQLYEIKELISYELVRDADAPCDGLRLSFYTDSSLGEIDRVFAYRGDKKVFFGYADTQREEYGENGYRAFIYARSAACLLVDNEAEPGEYNSPTARAMYLINAKPLGFKFSLTDYSARGSYLVQKGTSCYAAINDLVSFSAGRNITVTSDMKITLADGSGAFCIDRESVISERRVISRGDVISRLDCKLYDADGYRYHMQSRRFTDTGIKRSKKLNLSSFPEWQRSSTLKRMLKESARGYMLFKITVSGAGGGAIYDIAEYESDRFGRLEGYYISSICTSFDKNGEKTVYTLTKETELKEITYVD